MKQQKENGKSDQKPVGYGSSIQSSGYGNRNRPQQPIDKNQSFTANEEKIEKEIEKDR